MSQVTLKKRLLTVSRRARLSPQFWGFEPVWVVAFELELSLGFTILAVKLIEPGLSLSFFQAFSIRGQSTLMKLGDKTWQAFEPLRPG